VFPIVDVRLLAASVKQFKVAAAEIAKKRKPRPVCGSADPRGGGTDSPDHSRRRPFGRDDYLIFQEVASPPCSWASSKQAIRSSI